MAIYTFPSTLLHAAERQLELVAFSATSPQTAFNPQTFTDGPTSEFWQGTITIVPQSEADWRAVAALMRKLRGRRNKVRIFDPARTMRGTGGLASTVNVYSDAVAGATTITLENMVANAATGLAADDVFGLGENLYAVSDDAPTDSNGRTTISFLPPLRKGAAAGDPVTLSQPTGLFQLIGGSNTQIVRPSKISDPLALQFFEDPDLD